MEKVKSMQVQVENISREMETLRKNQKETLEIKKKHFNKNFKMTDRLSNSLNTAKERTRGPEDPPREIPQTETQNSRRPAETGPSTQEPWGGSARCGTPVTWPALKMTLTARSRHKQEYIPSDSTYRTFQKIHTNSVMTESQPVFAWGQEMRREGSPRGKRKLLGAMDLPADLTGMLYVTPKCIELRTSRMYSFRGFE